MRSEMEKPFKKHERERKGLERRTNALVGRLNVPRRRRLFARNLLSPCRHHDGVRVGAAPVSAHYMQYLEGLAGGRNDYIVLRERGSCIWTKFLQADSVVTKAIIMVTTEKTSFACRRQYSIPGIIGQFKKAANKHR